MKLAALIVMAIVFGCFGQTDSGATKVLHKGDNFKADQDYKLLTVSEAVRYVENLDDLKTAQRQIVEYKKILFTDSLQIELLSANLDLYVNLLDRHREMISDYEKMLLKKEPKWTDSKILWTSIGVVLVYVSSLVLENIPHN